VALGTDHERRLNLRARLKAVRLTCPLFDTDGWVADMDRLLLNMWDIHCSGVGPQTFEV
jgi:protein O-GlcNAc transferase